jgi:hypothetical protein
MFAARQPGSRTCLPAAAGDIPCPPPQISPPTGGGGGPRVYLSMVSQASCNVILDESVLFYFHNVNPTEIYTRLHGRPASSQPAAGQTAQLTGLCVFSVFIHNRWTLRGSEPGFGFLGEFWV